MNSDLKKYLHSYIKKKNEIKLVSTEKPKNKTQTFAHQKVKNSSTKKISHELKANLPNWAIVNHSTNKVDSKSDGVNSLSTQSLNLKTNEIYSNPNSNIKDLLKKLKIKPNDINLYIEALTHSSYSNENNLKINYQRLEFLGDAVLNKLVAVFLYSMSSDDEGKMTKDRISIIQAKTLVRASCELNLGEYVRLGHGLYKRPISEKILEDIFESFIGAIYLDQNETKVNAVLLKTLFKYYLNDDLKDTIDYKTKFQEAVQEHGKQKKIIYRRIENYGKKSSSNLFEVELVYNGIVYGRGSGLKLHDAEVEAAKKACEKISTNSFLKENK